MRRVLPDDQGRVAGQCLCGGVRLEIDYPAFWAWHDHSHTSRLAHGAAYATYVGSWRKRFRVVRGSRQIVRYEDRDAGSTRAFCGRCGTPLYYERIRADLSFRSRATLGSFGSVPRAGSVTPESSGRADSSRKSFFHPSLVVAIVFNLWFHLFAVCSTSAGVKPA